jgi:magnesium transporter
VLSKTTYPKIDVYPNYLFIILQFPVYEPDRHIFKRSEINIFFSQDYLITINDGHMGALQAFFQKCQTDKHAFQKIMKKGIPMLLWEVLDAHMDYMFPLVNQKNDLIYELEEEIYEKPKLTDMIKEIMTLKRDMINIRRILAPLRSVFLDLGSKHPKFVPEEERAYFDDLVDKQDKILNQLETAQAYVDVLEDANESLISRNTNNVVKTLTIFTVITQLPPIIFDYYGMNIALPFAESTHVLALVNAVTLLIVVSVIIYFRARRWF